MNRERSVCARSCAARLSPSVAFDRADAAIALGSVELAELVAQVDFLAIELDRLVRGLDLAERVAKARIGRHRLLAQRFGLLFDRFELARIVGIDAPIDRLGEIGLKRVHRSRAGCFS